MNISESAAPNIWNGMDLSKMSDSPEKFGRQLAKLVFAEGSSCVLIYFRLGGNESLQATRHKLSPVLEKMFTDAVRQKFQSTDQIERAVRGQTSGVTSSEEDFLTTETI